MEGKKEKATHTILLRKSTVGRLRKIWGGRTDCRQWDDLINVLADNFKVKNES